MYFSRTFTAAVGGTHQGTFQCARCSFVAAVEMHVVAEGTSEAPFFLGQEAAKRAAAARARKGVLRTIERHLNLYPCPLCRARRSRRGLALRCLGWVAACFLPVTLLSLIVVFFGVAKLGFGPDDLGVTAPFVLAWILGAASLLLVFRWRWRRAHREAETTVKLRRFWEWQLPSGPRVIAAQDPASGADAVWIDGARAAEPDAGEAYVVPLQAGPAGDPYRAGTTHAKLVFPAERTCWLSLGGKRIEPLRTSPDVV